jgi:hypothetical protein
MPDSAARTIPLGAVEFAPSPRWHQACIRFAEAQRDNKEAAMDDRKTETTERRTTIKDTSVPKGQTTNVNIRPDGGADIQVNDPAVGDEVVEETTTTTTRRTP